MIPFTKAFLSYFVVLVAIAATAALLGCYPVDWRWTIPLGALIAIPTGYLIRWIRRIE